jgi:hypothetical protein
MDGNGYRLDQRTPVEPECLWERDDDRLIDGPKLLHGASRIDADEHKVLAHMLVASQTSRTITAPHQRHDRDGIAYLEGSYAVSDNGDCS